MGLYLAVFDDSEELEGVEVGLYSDFGCFRDTVTRELERGKVGSLFPTLILHSDCDGAWTPDEASRLEQELLEIRERFKELPPTDLNSDWQRDVAKTFGIRLANLHECFFDVDGEPLIDRLLQLTQVSQKRDFPILFQ